MTMLSLSRRLGITPRADHDDDPTVAGWLDSGRPEGAHQGPGRQPLVPQQWAGTSGVRDRERTHGAAGGRAASGPVPTARGPHPLGGAESEVAPPRAAGSGVDARLSETRPNSQSATSAQPDSAWPEICDQFGSNLLVLAEQLRAALNALEDGEGDPERLKRLYQVDHAITRMRLASRQLRTLAGRNEQRLPGFTTSLLDVIRMAASAIEWYPQVSVGPVAELAVPGYAADDIATLMSALLDNATRFSPGTVTVSCQLLEQGGVMFRIEDTGLGMGRDKVARLNVTLAGPVPEVNQSTARHTGFPVVHRIARKHSIGVRFASRRPPGTGTLAMVTLPPQLVCAIPAQDPPRESAADGLFTPEAAASAAADLPRREPTGPVQPSSVEATVMQALPPQAALLKAQLPEAQLPAAAIPEAALPAAALPEAAPLPVASPAPVSAEITPLAPAPTSPEAVPPEAASAGPDRDAPPRKLPHRERVSLRADKPRPPKAAQPQPQPQRQPQPAAARQAFANDLSAFSQGIQEALAARGITGGLVSALFDGPVIKEGAQS